MTYRRQPPDPPRARDRGPERGEGGMVYLDSSVVLRVALRQPGRLQGVEGITRPVASAIVELECFRTLDRIRIAGTHSAEQLGAAWEAVHHVLAILDRVEITPSILARAAQPFPTPLGSLDALHLATALLLRESGVEELALATHDGALALAARAHGFTVLG